MKSIYNKNIDGENVVFVNFDLLPSLLVANSSLRIVVLDWIKTQKYSELYVMGSHLDDERCKPFLSNLRDICERLSIISFTDLKKLPFQNVEHLIFMPRAKENVTFPYSDLVYKSSDNKISKSVYERNKHKVLDLPYEYEYYKNGLIEIM